MKALIITIATLVIGFSVLASGAEAGPGGSAGYPVHSCGNYFGR